MRHISEPEQAESDLGNTSIADDLSDMVEQAEAELRELADLNAKQGQRGHSWMLPAEDGDLSEIPVWTSRIEWVKQVRAALNSEDGQKVTRSIKIATEKVFAVAVIHSMYADDRTGRGCSVSIDKIAERAGVSRSSVKRARTAIAQLGFGVEVARGRYLTARERLAAAVHHGGKQHRAASVWALTSPRESVVATQAANDAPTPQGELLPCGSSFISSTPVGSNSPKRASARGKSKEAQRKGDRPIAIQRMAAEIVMRAPSLAGGHIGSICDVLIRRGIDAERWTGTDVIAVLNVNSRRLGWMWPSEILSPAAFLHWRLGLIDFSGESPSERAAREQEEHRRAAAEKDRAVAEAEANKASAESRAKAMEMFRSATRRSA